MADTTVRYRPRDYRRVCDVCGNLRNISDMHRQDELWVCTYDAGERVRTQLDRLNARERPFAIKPVPHAKPQNQYYPNVLETDDAATFNFLSRQVAARCRFEFVQSGSAPYVAGGQALPSMSWAARYFYDLIQEGTRLLYISRAKVLLGQIADYLLTRQQGSPTGLSVSSTRANDAFFGGFFESGGTVWTTNNTSTSGLALLYAYRVLGATKYLIGARSAASYLRNVQAIGSNGTHFTSTDAAAAGRLYTGSLVSEVLTISGFYPNCFFYPSALLALEFWNELKITDGDQSIGATAAVTGFDTTPSQLLSQSITDLRNCWSVGITDATGTLVNGLSSTTPKEFFSAYPQGSGMWEYVDGGNATGTQISGLNFATALSCLYNYEGATGQVTTVSDWLRTFTSNPDFETPANTSTSVLYRTTTGTYDPTISIATLLQVRDPDTLAATKINASSLYDWGAFGLLSRLWASRNKASFLASRLFPLNVVQRYFDGNYNDGLSADRIVLRGMCGLTFQTGFFIDLNGTGLEASASSSSPATNPTTHGLAAWWEGGRSTITSGLDAGGDARMTDMTNLVFPINGHFYTVLAGFGDGPYTGLDTQDGHPSLTWRIDVDHTQSFHVATVGGVRVPQNLMDTHGNLFGHGVGECQSFTVIAVIMPRYDVGHFFSDITGGVVCGFGRLPVVMPMFELEDNASPGAFYLYSTSADPRAHLGSSLVLQGPHTGGGISGIYNGQPLILHLSSSGGTDITCRINGVEVPLTPAVQDLSEATGIAYICGNRAPGDNRARFKGTQTAQLIYDFKIDDSPAEMATTYSYLYGKFPSLAPQQAMVNDAVRCAQFGRTFREARS